MDECALRFKDKIYGKTGQIIRVHFPYRGTPQAQVLWTKDGRRMDKSDRHEVETTDTYSHMVIPSADRQKDSGKYAVQLSNKHGQNTYSIHVDVSDVPSKPRDFEVLSSTFSSMLLSWKEPEDDGGAPISNYIIEKKDIQDDEKKWTLVTSRTAQTTYKVFPVLHY